MKEVYTVVLVGYGSAIARNKPDYFGSKIYGG